VRLYDWSWWRKFRKSFLAAHPLCVMCEAKGLVVAAKIADHIEPHRENPNLFFDEKNVQALCRQCHGAKSAKEKLT